LPSRHSELRDFVERQVTHTAPAAEGLPGCQEPAAEWCKHIPLFRNWKKY
jgi:hypothetical protein